MTILSDGVADITAEVSPDRVVVPEPSDVMGCPKASVVLPVSGKLEDGTESGRVVAIGLVRSGTLSDEDTPVGRKTERLD